MVASPHLHLAKHYWSQFLVPGDLVIDATCGNGHDSLFLANLKASPLFALDIQESAINSTRKLLEQNLNESQLKQVILSNISHSNLNVLNLPVAPRLIVYNLGYLPGGDKKITTKTTSTLESVTSALSILAVDGAISITCYPGHAEGAKEEEALMVFTSLLSPTQWEVQRHHWLNRSRSPTLLWIRRLNTSS